MNLNFARGELCLSSVDLWISGILPIVFERRYRSGLASAGTFGFNWSSSAGLDVLRQQNRWILRGPNGVEADLTEVTAGGSLWDRATAVTPCLVRDSSGTFALHLEPGRRYVLARIHDAPVRMVPSRLEDRHGNAVQYAYRHGHLETILDDMGREVTLEHDSAGRLRRLLLSWTPQGIRQHVVATYGYDSAGNLVEYLDALGNRWRYTYDEHRLVAVQNPVGGVERASYDERGRCVGVWRSDGSRARFASYDDVRRTVRVVDARGSTWLYRLDDASRLLERVSPLGGRVSYHYDNHGGLLGISGDGAPAQTVIRAGDGRLEVTHGNGAKAALTMDLDGNLKRLDDACGNSWCWEYDDAGNLTRFTRPSGASTVYEYDRGVLREVRDPLGFCRRQALNRRDGSMRLEDDLGPILELRFDVRGLLTMAKDAQGRSIEIRRDAAGQIASVQNTRGVQVTYSRDALGRPTRVEVDGHGVETYEYDLFDRLTRHVDVLGAVTQVELGKEDTIQAIVDPEGRRNEFEFDSEGRVAAQRFLDGRSESYTYDAGGNLVEIRASGGKPILLDYDDAGKLTRKTYGDGNVAEFSYDPLRRLVRAQEPRSTASATYDRDGRVASESQDEAAVLYEYDELGNRTAWLLPDGSSVRIGYDGRGRAQWLDDSVCGRFEFTYDSLGQLTSILYPGGEQLSQTYDDQGSKIRQSLRTRNGVVLEREYIFDRFDRVIAAEWKGAFDRYHYDGANRLVRFQSETEERRYSYDRAGNLLVSEAGPIGYDRFGRLESYGRIRLEYGPEGLPRVLRDAETERHLRFDAEGRLSGSSLPNGHWVEFSHDMAARLVSRSCGPHRSTFLWAGALLIQEHRDGMRHRRVAYHPQLLYPLASASAHGVEFFVPDWKGMVIATFAGGAAPTALRYSPFGSLRCQKPDAKGQPFRLPGQFQDEVSGLHLNRFRCYIPEAGRFLTPDPLGLLMGTNLYAYGSNPVTDLDLYGLCDGELFYRTMSTGEAAKVMTDCQLSNKPGEPNHDCFVTQEKAYSEKLLAKHPETYQKLVEFCVSRGTARMMEDAAFAAASSSTWANIIFPAVSRAVSGANIIHLKFEPISDANKANKCLNYGLRRGRIGEFNKNIKSGKVLPDGPECTGPAA